jgi:hypothetical protein
LAAILVAVCRRTVQESRCKGQLRGDRTVAETEHASKPLAAPDRLAERTGLGGILEQTITESLVIPLTMVMHCVFCQRTFKRAPAEEDHAAKTFLLHRAHESLSEGI